MNNINSVDDLVKVYDTRKASPARATAARTRSLADKVAALIASANENLADERKITPRAGLIVASRAVAELSSLDDKSRHFGALRAVNNFITLASSSSPLNPLTASASALKNADLLPLGHPSSSSSKLRSLAVKKVRELQAEWYAADKGVDEDVRPLVAAAFRAEFGTPEHTHAVTRLSKAPTGSVPRDIMLMALVASFKFGNSMSSAARRARVALQLRDRRGRWIDMGRGLSFKFFKADGSVGSASGSYVGNETGTGYDTSSGSALIQVRGHAELPDGIYRVDGKKTESYQARIPGMRDAHPSTRNFDPSFSETEGIPNQADLIAGRTDTPLGWSTVSYDEKTGTKVFESDDNYMVTQTGDSFTLHRMTKEGAQDKKAVGTADSWAGVQKLASADSDAYDDFKSPPQDSRRARPESNTGPRGHSTVERRVPGDVQARLDRDAMYAARAKENEMLDQAIELAESGTDASGAVVPKGWRAVPSVDSGGFGPAKPVVKYYKMVGTDPNQNNKPVYAVASVDKATGALKIGPEIVHNYQPTRYDSWDDVQDSIAEITDAASAGVITANTNSSDRRGPSNPQPMNPLDLATDKDAADAIAKLPSDEEIYNKRMLPGNTLEKVAEEYGVDRKHVRAAESRHAKATKSAKTPTEYEGNNEDTSEKVTLDFNELHSDYKSIGLDPDGTYTDEEALRAWLNTGGLQEVDIDSIGDGPHGAEATLDIPNELKDQFAYAYAGEPSWVSFWKAEERSDEKPAAKTVDDLFAEAKDFLNKHMDDKGMSEAPAIGISAVQDTLADAKKTYEKGDVKNALSSLEDVWHSIDSRDPGDGVFPQGENADNALNVVNDLIDMLEKTQPSRSLPLTKDQKAGDGGDDGGDGGGVTPPTLPVAPIAPSDTAVPKQVTHPDVPNGVFQFRSVDYEPEGKIDEESRDFTDDPTRLSTKFTTEELISAYTQSITGNSPDSIVSEILNANVEETGETDEDGNPIEAPRRAGRPRRAPVSETQEAPRDTNPTLAVNNPSGAGQLEFSAGPEWVPAEALYNSLWEAGVDPNRVTAEIYDAINGNTRNLDALNNAGTESPEDKVVSDIMGEISVKNSKSGYDSVAHEKDNAVEEASLDKKFLANFQNEPVLFKNIDYYSPEVEKYEPTIETPEEDSGFSDDPVVIAETFEQADLIEQFIGGITDGSGVGTFDFGTEDTTAAEIPVESIRDALQLLGVDTNKIISEIPDEEQSDDAISNALDSTPIDTVAPEPEYAGEAVLPAGTPLSQVAEFDRVFDNVVTYYGARGGMKRSDAILGVNTDYEGTPAVLINQNMGMKIIRGYDPASGEGAIVISDGEEVQRIIDADPMNWQRVEDADNAYVKTEASPSVYSGPDSSARNRAARLDWDAPSSSPVVRFDPAETPVPATPGTPADETPSDLMTNPKYEALIESVVEHLDGVLEDAELIAVSDDGTMMFVRANGIPMVIDHGGTAHEALNEDSYYTGPSGASLGWRPLTESEKSQLAERIANGAGGSSSTVVPEAPEAVEPEVVPTPPPAREWPGNRYQGYNYSNVAKDRRRNVIGGGDVVRATLDGRQGIVVAIENKRNAAGEWKDYVRVRNANGSTVTRSARQLELVSSTYGTPNARNAVPPAAPPAPLNNEIQQPLDERLRAPKAYAAAPVGDGSVTPGVENQGTLPVEFANDTVKNIKEIDFLGLGPDMAAQVAYAGRNRPSLDAVDAEMQRYFIQVGSSRIDDTEPSIQKVKAMLRDIWGERGVKFGANGYTVEWQSVGLNSSSTSASTRYSMEGKVKDSAGSSVASVTRTISSTPITDSNGTVTGHTRKIGHAYLVFNGAEPKRNGFATAFNQYMEHWYYANKIDSVHVSAAGGGNMIGSYVWALQGFNFTYVSESSNFVERLKSVASTIKEKNAVSRLERMIASATDSSGRLDATKLPTPIDIALVGWKPGAKTWIGQSVMKATGWSGDKNLSLTGLPPERLVVANYRQLRSADKRIAAKANTPNVSQEFISYLKSTNFQQHHPELEQHLEMLRDVLSKNSSLATLSPGAKSALTSYVSSEILRGTSASMSTQDALNLRKALYGEFVEDNPGVGRASLGVGEALAKVSHDDVANNNIPGFKVELKIGAANNGTVDNPTGDVYKITHLDTGQLFFYKNDHAAVIHSIDPYLNEVSSNFIMNAMGLPSYSVVRSEVPGQENTIIMRPVGSDRPLGSTPISGYEAETLGIPGYNGPHTSSLIRKLAQPDDILKMLATDWLTNNADRHNGNYMLAINAGDPSKLDLMAVDNSIALAYPNSSYDASLADFVKDDMAMGASLYEELPPLVKAMGAKRAQAFFENAVAALLENVRKPDAFQPGAKTDAIEKKWGSTAAFVSMLEGRLTGLLTAGSEDALSMTEMFKGLENY